MSPPGAPSPRAAGARLRGLVVVLVLFFVLPALLFLRLAGAEGSTRVAAMILALTLPATGALVVRLNPDLVPDRATLRGVSPPEWAHLTLLGALLVAGAWWLTRLLAPP